MAFQVARRLYHGGFLAFVFASALVLACGDSAAPPLTSGDGDTTRADSGTTMVDGGAGDGPAQSFDSGPFGDILGTLSGSCGEVRAELESATPSSKVDTLTFVAGETYDKASLSSGGQKLFDTPNAGGSSGESEVMSFEVLHYCEGATLLKTETEVTYNGSQGSITDILVEINGKKVGVSVTRAYKPANQGAQSDAEIKALLEKKLQGINESSSRVAPADKWVKQVLHVLASTQASVEGIQRVLPTISAQLRSNTIVLVTKTIGGGFVYCNPDPPLGQECP